VIDVEEAQQVLGQAWVKAQSPELEVAEAVYRKLDLPQLILDVRRRKNLSMTGTVSDAGSIWLVDKR